MKLLSSDKTGTVIDMFEKLNYDDCSSYDPGQYVAAVYDHDWFLGIVLEKDKVENDFLIKFMKTNSQNLFKWPANDDVAGYHANIS